MSYGMWYVLFCRECDPELRMPNPFTSAADRGKWAAEHTRGTGHENWLVIDQPFDRPGHEGALFGTETV